jgi:dihydrofolate reductase
MAQNRVIGLEGKLPWHLPEDLKFFKRTTTNHAVLFGKTTFMGLGRALPNRVNLVLSRTLPAQEGIRVLKDMEEVKQLDLPLVFICGGAEIYRQFFPYCDELLLTRIHADYAGDTKLPPFEQYFTAQAILEVGENYRIERWVRNPSEAVSPSEADQDSSS